MRPFEEAVEAASASEEIPGAVLLATDKSGKPSYVVLPQQPRLLPS